MRMRQRPIRGQKIGTTDGIVVTIVKDMGEMVEVLMPGGKLSALKKDTLDLPVIDTSAYERL